MSGNKELQVKITQQLLKALEYLAYSYEKIIKLPDELENLDAESLETWESFAARFSRVADIFLAKYMRYHILYDDPGFRGSFRDFMNRGEKLKFIDDVDEWMTIRALRNLSVHEYADEDLTVYFRNLKKHTPKLLAIKKILNTRH